MITGEIRNKIDAIGDTVLDVSITNSITGMQHNAIKCETTNHFNQTHVLRKISKQIPHPICAG